MLEFGEYCKYRPSFLTGVGLTSLVSWGPNNWPKVLYLGDEHHITVPEDAMGGQTISVTLQVPEAVPVALAELVTWG